MLKPELDYEHEQEQEHDGTISELGVARLVFSKSIVSTVNSGLDVYRWLTQDHRKSSYAF